VLSEVGGPTKNAEPEATPFRRRPFIIDYSCLIDTVGSLKLGTCGTPFLTGQLDSAETLDIPREGLAKIDNPFSGKDLGQAQCRSRKNANLN